MRLRVAGVEAELAGNGGGGRAVGVGELIKYANLCEREVAGEEPFLQDANLLRVEAIEASNGGNAGIEAESQARMAV